MTGSIIGLRIDSCQERPPGKRSPVQEGLSGDRAFCEFLTPLSSEVHARGARVRGMKAEKNRVRVLHLLFGASGAAALNYQVLWVRAFADLFGETADAARYSRLSTYSL